MANQEYGYTTKSSSNHVGTSPNNTWNLISEHITTVVHTFLLMFVLLIISLCFVNEFSFFTWHPLLLTTGWVLLMTEGILSVRKHNAFTLRLGFKHKVRIHWVLEFLAVGLTVAGFIVVVIYKNQENRNHFTTWHGIFGLVGVIFATLAGLLGVLALYNVNLKTYIRPSLSKLIHVLTGILAFAFGGVSLLFLFQYANHWFASRTDDNQALRWLCFWGLLFSVVWTLISPIISSFTKIRNL